LHEISGQLYKILFKGLSDDITNDSNTEFPNAYKKFRQIVLISDERIAYILNYFLYPCNHDMKTTNIDTIYQVRENIFFILKIKIYILYVVISYIWINIKKKSIKICY